MNISVIIPTRDRCALFKIALNSVLAQTCSAVDIIVVDDGSTDANREIYRAMLTECGRPVRYLTLERHPRGHGQGYVHNYGVRAATTDYICFLDDDDYWTDPAYLERALNTLAGYHRAPDILMSNQAAYFRGVPATQPIWLESVANDLQKAGRKPDPYGAYAVTVDDLLPCQGHCHSNVLIVRRDFWLEVGGRDEAFLWEGDRDVYLRLIATANTMLYSPAVVSRHNIPDREGVVTVTTGASELERRLSQMRVFDKATLFSSHPKIRAYGRKHKGYSLKRITELLVKEGRYAEAYFYACVAFGAMPTLKWAGFTAWLGIQNLAGRGSPALDAKPPKRAPVEAGQRVELVE